MDARDDAIAAATLSLSDGVRRGPNRPEIENETTPDLVSWRRRASTLSINPYTTGRRDTHFVHEIRDHDFRRARVGHRKKFRRHDASHIWA